MEAPYRWPFPAAESEFEQNSGAPCRVSSRQGGIHRRDSHCLGGELFIRMYLIEHLRIQVGSALSLSSTEEEQGRAVSSRVRGRMRVRTSWWSMKKSSPRRPEVYPFLSSSMSVDQHPSLPTVMPDLTDKVSEDTDLPATIDKTTHGGEESLPPPPVLTPEHERRLWRRIDWRFVPIMTMLCSASFLDRSNIGECSHLEHHVGGSASS